MSVLRKIPKDPPRPEECTACGRQGVKLEQVKQADLDVKVCVEWRSCINAWPKTSAA